MQKGFLLLVASLLGSGSVAMGQIDSEKRQLFQLGYNQPFEGRGPLSAYAFYYRNDPEFLRTNLALRLAIAPVFIDSELGIRQALGEHTDLGIGVAGGGYAYSYSEVRRGRLVDGESFAGHGGEISSSLYHLFNPGKTIPLYGIFRLGARYSVFEPEKETKSTFVLPDDQPTYSVRTGLRWGGKLPVINDELAMEVSLWYEGLWRGEASRYGLGGDRQLESASHLFWSRALIVYTFPTLQHTVGLNLTAGTSIDADRFSSYRLGGHLPLLGEFPLMLPGYYYQEISASQVALLSGHYSLPLDAAQRWSLTAVASAAVVDHTRGVTDAGTFHSGIGLGLGYQSASDAWRTVIGYSYGFNAIRGEGHGAQSIGILLQFDLEKHHKARGPLFDIESPFKSRGLFRIFGD